MLLSQYDYLITTFLTSWRTGNRTPSSSTGISFNSATNTITSASIDIQVDDRWILVENSSPDGNAGFYRLDPSNPPTASTLTLDSTYRTVTDESAGNEVHIIPVRGPVKFPGQKFRFPKDKLSLTDHFAELEVFPGDEIPVAKINDGKLLTDRLGIFTVMINYSTELGQRFGKVIVNKLNSVFKVGNLENGIRISQTSDNGGIKTEQSEYWTVTFSAIITCRVDQRALISESGTDPNIFYGRLVSLATPIVQTNTFVRFDAVRLDAAGDWIRASLADPYPATHIVIEADSTSFTVQSSGPVTYNSGHGLPLNQVFHLTDNSNSPNTVNVSPSVGKSQALFVATTPFTVDIAIQAPRFL